MPTARQWRQGLLAALLFPATVILHELGHFGIGWLSGFPVALHYASVTGLPEAAPYAGAPLAVALAALAGPAISLAMLAAGMAGWRRIWGLPLLAAALPRFVVNLLFMVQQGFVLAGIAQAGRPNIDEANAARALDVPAAPLAAIGAMALLAGLWAVWRRAGAGGVLMLALGTGLGMAGWLVVLGPRLLP